MGRGHSRTLADPVGLGTSRTMKNVSVALTPQARQAGQAKTDVPGSVRVGRDPHCVWSSLCGGTQ